MTVSVDGVHLTREELVRVARGGERVELTAEARSRMELTRAVVERSRLRDDTVYGLSTGVGVLKRVGVSAGDADAYSTRMIRHHRVAQGPAASRDTVRGTALRLLNAFAEGSPGVRPALADALVDAIGKDRLPAVRSLGSVGQADLAQMADLASGVFDGVQLAAGEGLALLSSNAFSTASAALAVTDAAALLSTMETAAALSLEGLAANPSMLHAAIARVRPYPGLAISLGTLRALLDGSFLWSDPPRQLQDPLSFRNSPQIIGAVRDVLAHMEDRLAIELNASQGNPIVVPEEEAVVSVADYEILPLSLALDYLRLALVPALGAAAERAVKLLETPWSGLPTGLSPDGGGEPGLSYLGIAVQSLAAETRLLAAPVSHELTSTSHAEGIEDRTTLAPLAARRLAELVELGHRVVAVELAVATQAVELRGSEPLGSGTSMARRRIRSVVPYLGPGDVVPDLEPLVRLVASGALAAAAPR
ncbi:MAG TPA: aromatic amino acid ammonia-lyase [Candidatus Dormibacteraeota bacterium]|nr:aromatic amino acid ammonia-lyase [Candidatus Dormibacteraeota bacterium]